MKELWQQCTGVNSITGEPVYTLYVEGEHELLVNSMGEEVKDVENVAFFET